MDRSPVSAVLDELNLTTQEAALAANCQPAGVSACKSGQPIPLALRVFLVEAGVDVCALEREQTAWRVARGSEIRNRVMGRGGAIPAVTQRVAVAGVNK